MQLQYRMVHARSSSPPIVPGVGSTYLFILPTRSNTASVTSDRPQRRLTGTALRPCTLVPVSLAVARDHSHTLSHSLTLLSFTFQLVVLIFSTYLLYVGHVTHNYGHPYTPTTHPPRTLPLHENTPPPSAARTLLYY